jgi:hypothetical protein
LLAGIAEGFLGATVGGTIGELAQIGIQMRTQGLMLKYSRAMALYKAGYNPKADFFKTVESQGGQEPPQWLGDQPNPGIANRPLRKK